MINGRFDTAKEKLSEFQDTALETLQNETQREKWWDKRNRAVVSCRTSSAHVIRNLFISWHICMGHVVYSRILNRVLHLGSGHLSGSPPTVQASLSLVLGWVGPWPPVLRGCQVQPLEFFSLLTILAPQVVSSSLMVLIPACWGQFYASNLWAPDHLVSILIWAAELHMPSLNTCPSPNPFTASPPCICSSQTLSHLWFFSFPHTHIQSICKPSSLCPPDISNPWLLTSPCHPRICYHFSLPGLLSWPSKWPPYFCLCLPLIRSP